MLRITVYGGSGIPVPCVGVAQSEYHNECFRYYVANAKVTLELTVVRI